MKICKNCGAEMNDGEQICSVCGDKNKKSNKLRSFVITIIVIIVVGFCINRVYANRCFFVGHKYLEATCTSPTTCSVCGKEEGKPSPHKFGDWSIVKAATCTEKGSQERICEVCKFTESEDIDIIPHSFGEWSTTKEATCTEKGVQERSCEVCGAKESKDTDIIPHNFGEWTIVKEATCSSTGSEERVCEVCGFKESESIDQIPHTPGDWEISVKATKTSNGRKIQKCIVCGEIVDSKDYEYSILDSVTSMDILCSIAAVYLAETLKDPSSFKVLSLQTGTLSSDSREALYVDYNAKNGFGGTVRSQLVVTLDMNGTASNAETAMASYTYTGIPAFGSYWNKGVAYIYTEAHIDSYNYLFRKNPLILNKSYSSSEFNEHVQNGVDFLTTLSKNEV